MPVGEMLGKGVVLAGFQSKKRVAGRAAVLIIVQAVKSGGAWPKARTSPLTRTGVPAEISLKLNVPVLT
jgi:hypothetical protein